MAQLRRIEPGVPAGLVDVPRSQQIQKELLEHYSVRRSAGDYHYSLVHTSSPGKVVKCRVLCDF